MLLLARAITVHGVFYRSVLATHATYTIIHYFLYDLISRTLPQSAELQRRESRKFRSVIIIIII